MKIFGDENGKSNKYLEAYFHNERKLLEKIGNQPEFCNLVTYNNTKLSFLMEPVGLPIKMDIIGESLVNKLLCITKKLHEKNVSMSLRE